MGKIKKLYAVGYELYSWDTGYEIGEWDCYFEDFKIARKFSRALSECKYGSYGAGSGRIRELIFSRESEEEVKIIKEKERAPCLEGLIFPPPR